jgi:hypothetical protein
MASMLVIEHKDGRQYAVSAADFRRIYEPQGFKAVAYESGEPYSYEPPAKKADSAAKADEKAE